MSPQEPIAIIGSACRFPGSADTPSKLWNILREPRDLLQKVPESRRFNSGAFFHSDPEHHGTTNVQASYFLDEDPAVFDNTFFNIQPNEAEAIDPQQRMLMETVYDSVSSAGQTIEGLRGSSTAIIVGTMCDDWSGMLYKDWENLPQYSATGMGRSIMSNRLSYFFDWHGPSITLDTACSSSLVAVHLAIQSLHSGESQMAVAAGANLLLSPGMYIAEANLHMLSPTGRSRMWDKDVDGYARGEGFASVVLKTLSAAIRDGDHIESIIRATGINQDGKTQGLTMPSATAQAALIRNTYAQAGLDLSKPEDRPQFFHAHGTGTPAGDPQEAEAISEAFYPNGSLATDMLYVGSIKTIIGHSEGTAGLASLIGSSLALQHGVIPPNMHFNELNPKIAPFYKNLKVPTSAASWPKLVPGQPRRVSVNSFGFGGTNAHAVIESYRPPPITPSKGPLFTPLVISAATEKSLRALMSSYSEYLKMNPHVSLRDFAYTIQERRSTLAYRASISASTTEEAYRKIDALLESDDAPELSTRHFGIASPRILAIFTGQGAQWPRMGAKLVESSPFVSKRLDELDAALASLPYDVRPQWTLRQELLADAASSRITEAAISQPLCTAIQILLVELLQLAGIKLSAVVGHSSGEIGAAYAAGLLSADTAIRVAYLRGLYAKLSKSPNGIKGAMVATGTSFDDASEFCQMEEFEGRLQVAAVNSSSSITLSGDEDAVAEAIDIFQDEGKFARKLKVDTAYHSAHMIPCSAPYLASMEALGDISTPSADFDSRPLWYSSVLNGKIMSDEDLSPQYWVDNMTNTVLFAPAVAAALEKNGSFDLVLEIGPHAALKGPCLDTLSEGIDGQIPYCGLLSRGQDDIIALSTALGFLWSNLDAKSVSFETFEKSVSGDLGGRHIVTDLPKYPFDNSKSFWSLSRAGAAHAVARDPPHPILGRRCTDRETSHEIQWRNILTPKEISWLKGHKIQGQIVFPAAGFVAMAVEAMKAVAKSTISLIKIENLFIGRAIAFNDENSNVESLFSVKLLHSSNESIEAKFSCYSGGPHDAGNPMALNAEGTITVSLAEPEADSIAHVQPENFNMTEIEVDRFYEQFRRLEYEYSAPFRGILTIDRKNGHATGTLENQAGSDWEDQLLIHPGMLDTAFQSTSAAFSCPGDGHMWGLYIPAGIESIVINPFFAPANKDTQDTHAWEAIAKSMKGSHSTMDINIFSQDNLHTFIQVEGLELMPFTAARPENDAVLFSRFDYKIDRPNADLVVVDDGFSAEAIESAIKGERISFYYLRRLLEAITPEDKANTLPHYRHMLTWASHVVELVKNGKNPFVPANAQFDTEEQINNLFSGYRDRTDLRLIDSVGKNLLQVIRNKTGILEHMEGLFEFYDQGLGLDMANRHMARLIAQVGHRYPRMKLLEIGAGTGGSTRTILSHLGPMFSSYTYTDISSGFFEAAQERFKDYSDRMIYKTFDMEQPPASQGFVEESYDIVLASNVLHATDKLEEMMTHARQLLKPGGYLIVLELTSNDSMRIGLPMGPLPGWWVGAETGRPMGPTVTLPKWDALLRRHGFGGIDTSTPMLHKLHVSTVFVAQAIDDRISLLRSPLSSMNTLPSTEAPRLVIVGGETLTTHRIAEQAAAVLAPRFSSIERIASFDELEDDMPYSSTVLSLTELDDALFKNITPRKLIALKTLWRQGGNILWVTRGARSDEPFSAMSHGLGRAMIHEYPNITLQVLDLDRLGDEETTTRLLVEELLRLEILKKWKGEGQGGEFLWSIEPEVCMQSGTRTIPRLYKCEDANKRYNSHRRTVTKAVNVQEHPILFASEGSTYKLEDPSPLHLTPHISSKSRTVQISHFLLQTIEVASYGKLMLFVGTDHNTADRVLGLSPVTESRPTVPADWTVAIGENHPAKLMVLVAAHITTSRILKLVPSGSTVLVHEPDLLVGAALTQQSKDLNVRVVITTALKSQVRSGWRYVSENLPRRLVKKLLSNSVKAFVNLSQAPGSARAGELLRDCAPRSCIKFDSEDFYGTSTELQSRSSPSEVSEVLKSAWLASAELLSQIENPSVVSLQALPKLSIAETPLTIVDCMASTVEVSVQAIDSGVIFRADRTYFLVGMSGQVGQSLCQWMVGHGAKYVVLTSRRPKVHPEFIKSMEAMNATVKILALDITKKESLQMCYEEMSKTMPPVAGVAQGAMVLEDSMFEGLTFENLTKVLDPKVTGTQLLDELFYDAPLDFFVVMSSLTSIVGNSGQSNYTAANMFMVALAEQRRQRGVAGSSIAISSLIGIGYVERSENFSSDYFENIGYRNISEQDLHQLFAEAILVGRPGCTESSEIATGLQPFYPERNSKAQFFDDIRFDHFILEHQEVQDYGGKLSAMPIRVQLAEAKTKDEAYAIVKDGFSLRLKRTLMISQDDTINEKASLIEQGIDSLMAVEVRTWFLKELDVDIPVLRILGGSSITDLLADAMERVPVSVLDLNALSSNTKPAEDETPKQATSSRITSKIQENPPDSPDTGSKSTSSASPSTSAEPSRTPVTEMELSVEDISKINVEEKLLEAVPKTQLVSGKEEIHEMSYGQARFWFLSGYLTNKKSFNMSVMFKLTGKLQVDRLEKAVETIAQRHEALRTRYFWSGEGDQRVPMQGILSEPTMRLESKRIGSDADAKDELRKIHDHTWDLNSWEAAKMKLFSISDNEHYFLVSGHHISWDGYAFSVLFIDLDAAYAGRQLPPLGVESQYRSFAAWQRNTYKEGAMKKALDTYYRPMIDPHAKAIPLFSFAKSPTRPLLDDFAQFEAKATLQPNFVSKLKQLAKKNHSTMFHVYLAALQGLVFRHLPDEEKFYLGVADANRLDKKFMGSLGFFLNLLPVLFTRSPPGKKISDMIKDTRNKAYKSLENSFVPWDVILKELKVERTNTEAPIFQLFVDYRQIARERSEFCGCKLSDEDWMNARNGYDLTLGITDNPTGESLLSLRFQQKLYSESSTALFLRSYVHVLETMASAVDLEVSELPRWAPSDIETAIKIGRGLNMKLEWPITVSHRIDQMIERHGSKPALKDGLGNSLTYAQMKDRIDSIAIGLMAAGATERTPVGVFQDPSADWICSMMAVFKVGAIYVPLDLRNSVARLASIVDAARPTIILTDLNTTSKFKAIGGSIATEILVSEIVTVKVSSSLPNRAKPEDPAVILFTSGTTGKPKGVILTHDNLRAQCEGYSRFCDIPSMVSVVLQQTNYNFDVSLDQIFAALADGGCLYVVPARDRGDPQAITKSMAAQGVTYTVATPSEYEMWFRYAPKNLANCKSWRYAFGGGEHLHNGLIQEFANLAARDLPLLRLFNNYGPTEASLAITKGEVKHSDPELEAHVPAGFIIPNYQVVVVDENLSPVPCEASGEILAGGPGVAAGYLGLAEMTKEKFLHGHNIHPLAATTGRWYRTGDRGRLRQDGALYVDGRILEDSQVKIRGFRVELGEVEVVILEAAKGALSHAVVTARGSGEDRFLAAHVVFAPEYPQHRRQDLIKHLESKLPLPTYMQPSIIVTLDSIPVTNNFKLDRKAILEMSLPEAAVGNLAHLADTEQKLAELWGGIIPHILGVNELTSETNFFDVGGNSILLVKLKAAIKRTLDSEPLLIDLMNSSTLGGMARIVSSASGSRTIDWDAETSLTKSLSAFIDKERAPNAKKGQSLSVILTGSTGYLGRHILSRLINNPQVNEIHCLIRPETLSNLPPPSSSKVIFIPTDLSKPLLGLTPSAFVNLSRKADVVINCAANRSFWDGYEKLQPVNLDAVKELALLCIPNSAPLHTFSSGAVRIYDNSSPPTDGSDGYVVSKWAAERFLHNAARLSLPIHIHRPLAVPNEKVLAFSDDTSVQAAEIQKDLVAILRTIGKVPDFSSVSGYVDVTPVKEVVDTILGSVLGQENGKEVKMTEYKAKLRLYIKDFANIIAGDETLRGLPTMNPLFWFGEVKKQGFGQLITAQHLVMHQDGEEIIARR